VIELIEQDRAGSASEEPLDHCASAENFPVRPEYEMLEHLAERGFSAIWVLAGQLKARRYSKLSVDMGEAGPQRRNDGNVRLHRHVFRDNPLDQAGPVWWAPTDRLRCLPMRLSYHILYEAGDELDGLWSRERLIEMNTRFTEQLEEAFELGLESRDSAAGQVKLPVSPGPRWATPLTREIQEGLWRSSAASALVMVVRG